MTNETAIPRSTTERLELVPMPRRIAALQRDHRGYPIPRFIDRAADRDGKPDFRIMDGGYMRHCIKHKTCWICGEPLGRYMTFPIGPMCAINRNIAEPPSHLECCQYSAKVCPFLSVPEMRRIGHNMPDGVWVSGEMIPRNPGALCLWTVRQYKTWSPARGELLFDIGEPVAVEWWCRGRAAAREEVDASIASGLPLLEESARRDPKPGAMEHLSACIVRAQKYLPAALAA
jgi:hypothetical protein